MALTAKTRNRDVLPAFCRPIMVMSISVALRVPDNTSVACSQVRGEVEADGTGSKGKAAVVAAAAVHTKTGAGANRTCDGKIPTWFLFWLVGRRLTTLLTDDDSDDSDDDGGSGGGGDVVVVVVAMMGA